MKFFNRLYVFIGKWYFQFGILIKHTKPRWCAICFHYQRPVSIDEYLSVFNYTRKMNSIREFGCIILGFKFYIKLD